MNTERDQKVPEGRQKGRRARPAQPLVAAQERRGPAFCAPSSHADANRHWAKAKIRTERRATNKSQNEREKS